LSAGSATSRRVIRALAAFAKAGLAPEDAYGAVKATALVALSVGAEKSLASSGGVAQTQVDDLPPEDFPHLHALADIESEEAAWAFTLETLVSGLRTQIRRRRT